MAAVLEACGLSSFGILGELVGTCGIELGEGCGLLRSVCVTRNQRRRGIAERLVGWYPDERAFVRKLKA